MPSPLKFPTVDSKGVSSAQAASDLAGLWRDDLALGAAECDEPGFELLERAAHGELDADEAEMLALRTEWDEKVARELADLQALAGRLQPQRAQKSARPLRGFLASRTARFAGLAAMLLLVAGALGRLDRRDQLQPPAMSASAAPATHASSTGSERRAPLFRDGFESGSAASWAN